MTVLKQGETDTASKTTGRSEATGRSKEKHWLTFTEFLEGARDHTVAFTRLSHLVLTTFLCGTCQLSVKDAT